MNTNFLRKSIVTAIIAASASGQLIADEAQKIEEVVVTGSRVITDGFQTPTPVTVANSEDLRAATPNLIDALRQIPQLSGSSSPASTSPVTGAGPTTDTTANLRGVGAERTLVLLDGRRTTPSLRTGSSDMSFFPMSLVKRVEIVTGGASAAYGSGAVSGVVNFILDTDFEGLSAEVRAGTSQHSDADSYGVELSGGTSFADGRGHFIFSIDARGQDGLDGDERAWSTRHTNTILNPDRGQPGQPTHLLRDNITSSVATFNGLIMSPGPLFRTTFDDMGNPMPLEMGSLVSGAQMVGGGGAAYEEAHLAKSDYSSIFLHTKYDLTDNLEIFIEGSYGETTVGYPLLFPYSFTAGFGYNIKRDNAYLPESIGEIMDANGINSFALWKFDADFGRDYFENDSDQYNITVGLKADLEDGWLMNAYYSKGETNAKYSASGNLIFANAKAATDAVVNPANGQIVCRSSLTDTSNGCVPHNIFGSQPISAELANYALGTSWGLSISKQEVAAVDFSGKPFSTWAGPVSVAFGAEWRDLSNDIKSSNTSGAFDFCCGVYLPSSGSYDVYEGFVEALIPLAKDAPFAKDLSINTAFRRTNYSTSGDVDSWKVGLVDEIFDGFRLRATRSRDIRAPHIGELFGGTNLTISTVVEGGQTYQNIITQTGSNEELNPEISDTTTIGFVYQPPQIEGLGLSVDYYKIEIKDAITTLNRQTIVDLCDRGNGAQDLCALITRNANGEIIELKANQQNVASLDVKGYDIEASYNDSAFGGDYRVRAVATYLDTMVLNVPGSQPFEQAGYTFNPHWQGNIQATFASGPWAFTVTERILGSSYRLAMPNLVDDAKTDLAAYTHINAKYSMELSSGSELELYANINNLFDKDPQLIASNSQAFGFNAFTEAGYYDTVGRFYTIGARYNF